MTEAAIAKWNKAAKCLEASQHGEELRYGIFKRQLFGKATGRTMLVAAGTGVDFKYFPADVELTAIDFSPTMLEYAEKKVGECPAPMTLKEADVTCLDFPDAHFDTVATSCTFCSVPDPVKGLREVRRVLKDDGALLMFEHVRLVQLLPGLPDGPDEPGGQTDRTRHQPSNRRQCPGGGIPADAGVQRLSRYVETVRGGEGGVSRSRKAYRPVPLSTYERLDENEMIERARAFRDELRRRRTVRHYSGEPVPQEVIEACIEAAGTAPNGANRQPWHFVVVRDPEVKSRIRKQAEEEELDFYENRAPPEWLEALAHLGTDSHKPFLAGSTSAHRDLRGKLQTAGRREGQELLRNRAGGDRHRNADHRSAPSWPRDADPHPQPHGLPERDPRQAQERAPLPAPSRRLSSR